MALQIIACGIRANSLIQRTFKTLMLPPQVVVVHRVDSPSASKPLTSTSGTRAQIVSGEDEAIAQKIGAQPPSATWLASDGCQIDHASLPEPGVVGSSGSVGVLHIRQTGRVGSIKQINVNFF